MAAACDGLGDADGDRNEHTQEEKISGREEDRAVFSDPPRIDESAEEQGKQAQAESPGKAEVRAAIPAEIPTAASRV
jgi:hypothetical protein